MHVGVIGFICERKSNLSRGLEEQKLRNQETVERHKNEFSDNRLKISPRF